MTLDRSRRRALAPVLAVLLASAAVPALAAPAPPQAPAQPERPDVTIGAPDRAKALATLSAEIEARYPDPEAGARTAQAIRRRAAAGAYDRTTSARAFAQALTADLRDASKDQHFLVDYFVVPRPFPPAAQAGVPDQAARETDATLRNHGVERVERLAGNIGYLRVSRFYAPESTGDVLAAAMRLVGGCDALIIDLRDNGGGFAGTANLLASYLTPASAQLSELRSRDDVKQFWTAAWVPGGRYGRPVYVLTSARTFSAAEGFAYDLQAMKRVTVVGETTRGGANPSDGVLLSERFGAVIPSARARNPITGGNWDGTGVKPDVAVPAAEALDAAWLAAAERAMANHPDDPLTQELRSVVERLRKPAP
jgi:hypothetical protein